MVSDENLWAMCMLRVSLRACCTPVKMKDLPPRMCQESCVPCLARNGNIRAPCIALMVDPLRGARPASSAARQEALSLRGGACGTNRTGTQNEEWGWIKRSVCHDIYRDGEGDEATQSCWTTALYTYYIHITTKITCKAVQEILSIPATPPGCGNFHAFPWRIFWRFTIGIAIAISLEGAKVRASATLSRHNAKSMAGP